MTDQPDDTLLDDDVEEHDFNFDNEKEEALLADNEFDAFIEDHPKEKSLDPEDVGELEHLDQEEDVLDIGIAEEDIVENELISTSNTLDKPVDLEEPEEKVLEGEPTLVTETDVDQFFESEQISNTTDVEKEDENEETLAAGTDSANTSADDDKHVSSEQDEEMSAKPTVISLKKHDKKSYDGLPDLAKVIELVQPHGSSRNRKHGRPLPQFTKKTRPSDGTKVNRHGDSHERNDRRSDDNYYRGGKNEFRSNDGSKRSYSNDGRDTSMEMMNRSQRVTEMHSSHNFVSEYKNFSSQSLVHRPNAHVDRPIVATVQITREQYQIAGDFQLIRPSMENSCQPLIRPFEQNRMFQSRGTLPPHQHQMQRPTNQYGGNGYPGGIRPLMPPSNTNNSYNRAALLPPPAPHQMPRRPLLPPPGAGGISPQPMRQRFPSHSGPPPQQNFPPPFMGPNGPPPGPAYHPNYQQTRSQFGLNSAPPPQFPQNFARPPPFSQPPPPLNSSNGQYYSGNPSHMPNSGPPAPNPMYQNRPPPPANMQGHFPRMSNEGSHSVVFQQSSQRIIRMPPPGNVNDNSQCVMNNSGHIGPPPQGDYYVKESITTTSSTYLPPPLVNQPPPPGVPSYQSAPPVSYAADNSSHLRNDQVENCHYSRDDYYADQSGDRYSRYSKSNYQFRDDAASLDRDRNAHDLKRSSLSSMDDNGSAKRYRYNYSNNKSHDDGNDEEMEYRKKVEDQKKMREKFVQMKEEQRLKNQMQNFIHNNIKGFLQRREQLLKKNETDSNPASRSVNVKTKDDGYRLEESNRSRSLSSAGNVSDKSTSNRSPPRKQFDYKDTPNSTGNRCPTEDTRTPPTVFQRLQSNGGVRAKEVPERMKVDDDKNDTRNTTTKQLHKVVKIKYKDGTVALKSFPVVGPNKRNVSSIEKSSSGDSLNVTLHDEDSSSSSNRRRMIVSKQPSSFGGDNAPASSHNENIIVESVRKGVTQSSVPLAQRFSNLKPTQKDENDEDSSVSAGMKSKNRLVISHEEKMRTVWIKNISLNTKTSLIQKIAGTCGTITRMRWITGNGQYNEAKITFSKVDEAKKFIHNYHRKTVDTSLILVTSMTAAENK